MIEPRLDEWEGDLGRLYARRVRGEVRRRTRDEGGPTAGGLRAALGRAERRLTRAQAAMMWMALIADPDIAAAAERLGWDAGGGTPAPEGRA